jgi:hypothetical protein
VVDDIEAARMELAGRGVEVSDVQTFDWGSFVFFSDPGRQRLVRPAAARPRVAPLRRAMLDATITLV